MNASNPSGKLQPTAVVLVDDNELDNEFHQIILRKFDPSIPVMVFDGGEAFLQFLRSPGRPHGLWVFLDINMPMMTGFEVLECMLKEGMDVSGERIYILSSSSSPDDRQRAANDPLVSGYLTKPLTTAALVGLGHGA